MKKYRFWLSVLSSRKLQPFFRHSYGPTANQLLPAAGAGRTFKAIRDRSERRQWGTWEEVPMSTWCSSRICRMQGGKGLIPRVNNIPAVLSPPPAQDAAAAVCLQNDWVYTRISKVFQSPIFPATRAQRVGCSPPMKGRNKESRRCSPPRKERKKESRNGSGVRHPRKGEIKKVASVRHPRKGERKKVASEQKKGTLHLLRPLIKLGIRPPRKKSRKKGKAL